MEFPFFSVKMPQEVVLITQGVYKFTDDRMVSYLQQSMETGLFVCECDRSSDVFETDSSDLTAYDAYTSYLSRREIYADLA